MADGCVDPLLEVKLQFMLSIAKILQAFLIRLQTDKPMLPFLVSDEVDLVQDLSGGSRGFVGFGRTPLRPDPGVVTENMTKRTKRHFTETAHNLIWQHEYIER